MKTSAFITLVGALFFNLLAHGEVPVAKAIDMHSHIACFRKAPSSEEYMANPAKYPCYVGDTLRTGEGLTLFKRVLATLKFKFYPDLFGLKKGEDYAADEANQTFSMMKDRINSRVKYMDGDVERTRVRFESEKYNDDTVDFYPLENLSHLLELNRGVKKAVVLAMDQVYDRNGVAQPSETAYYVSNEFLVKGLAFLREKLGRDNLLYGASVHPFRKDALKELEYAKRHGAKLVKWIAAVHQIPVDDQDPRLRAFYLKLAELKLPLLVHIDEEGSFGKMHVEYTGAFRLAYPLSLGVKLIVAHVATKGATVVPGGARSPMLTHYEQLKRLIDEDLAKGAKGHNGWRGQLYADISVLPMAPTVICRDERKFPLYDIVHDDYEKYWKGRLLYGSDYPLNHPFMRPRYCFVSYLSPKRSFFKKLFESNGVSAAETDRAYSEGRHWDHDQLMKRSFGVPEEVFAATEKFLNENP